MIYTTESDLVLLCYSMQNNHPVHTSWKKDIYRSNLNSLLLREMSIYICRSPIQNPGLW